MTFTRRMLPLWWGKSPDLDAVHNIEDLRLLARCRLPRTVFDYLEGGAEDELTLRENRAAFDRWQWRPRLLRGEIGVDGLSVTLCDQTLNQPFLIGPTGLNGLFWRNADACLMHAAWASGTAFTLSTAANLSLEVAALQRAGPLWFQLYPWGRGEFVSQLIYRARKAGCQALVVTVDSLVPGKRERDLRNGFAHAMRWDLRKLLDGVVHPHWSLDTWLRGGGLPRFENVAAFVGETASALELADFTRRQRNPNLQWNDLEWIRSRWQGPLWLKGVLCAEDVALARKVGVDGVVVSNHGGRQLDGVIPAIDALPAVVAAAGPGMPVLLDSGVRRGSDVVKALALGARAVLLGRAVLYGVAAAGEAGVVKALAIFEDEVRRTMALVGVSRIDQLNASLLVRSGETRQT